MQKLIDQENVFRLFDKQEESPQMGMQYSQSVQCYAQFVKPWRNQVHIAFSEWCKIAFHNRKNTRKTENKQTRNWFLIIASQNHILAIVVTKSFPLPICGNCLLIIDFVLLDMIRIQSILQILFVTNQIIEMKYHQNTYSGYDIWWSKM